MKTKLDYYRIFYETARYESFSKAAKNLFISQSAISQCIHQLEEDLSTKLFIRTRRGVTLTKEGLLLFNKVESAMDSILQGETILARLNHLDSGSLVIAAADTITNHFLLPFLEQFHNLYPNIRIEMANSYSYEMLRLVKEGTAELAFINLPAKDDELIIEPCLNIHDIFVVAKDYKLKKEYSWTDIEKEPLILIEKKSVSRNFIDEEFEKKKITLKPNIEVASHEVLLRFATIHLGVSCVVEEFSQSELNTGKINKLNLVPPLSHRSIAYAHLKHNTLSKPAQAFLDLIKNK